MTPFCSHSAGSFRRMHSSTMARDVLRAAEHVDDVDALARGEHLRQLRERGHGDLPEDASARRASPE